MADDIPVPATHSATACGWVRIPEKDGVNFDAWELPDGMMLAYPKGQVPPIRKWVGAPPTLRDAPKDGENG